MNDELVLDLVGVVDRRGQQYSASSLQNIFSSSKAVASIIVAMLVDRGHLTYEMKVADIWPGTYCTTVVTAANDCCDCSVHLPQALSTSEPLLQCIVLTLSNFLFCVQNLESMERM